MKRPCLITEGVWGFIAAKRRAAGYVPVSSVLLEQLQGIAAQQPPQVPDAHELAPAPPSAVTPHPALAEQGPDTDERRPPPSDQERGDTLEAGNLTAAVPHGALEQNGAAAPRLALQTRLIHAPKATTDPYGAVAPPLYQTATFDQPSATDCGPYDYTRSGNPTRALLEAQMADLEVGCKHQRGCLGETVSAMREYRENCCILDQGADRSFAFASGMAALAVVLRLAGPGGHIVAGDDLYGGTSRLLAQVAPNWGLQVTHVDTGNPQYSLFSMWRIDHFLIRSPAKSFRLLSSSPDAQCTQCMHPVDTASASQ